MAEVPTYYATVTVGDSAKKLTTVRLRVDATDGKAYVAAADKTARDATKVGLLQLAVFDLMKSSQYQSFGLDTVMVNDAFAYPDENSDTYNSDKLNVFYSTTVGGLPRNLQFTIPQREPSSFDLESNGINVDLSALDVPDLITQILDTMLSTYGTAVTAVPEITVNDQ